MTAPIDQSNASTQYAAPKPKGWRAPRWLTQCAIWSLLPLLAILIGGDTVHAQTFNFDLGEGPGVTSSGRLIQLIGLITVLSIAPAILMMVTSFTRIIVVLSLLRTALGIQQSPPNQVLISLAQMGHLQNVVS